MKKTAAVAPAAVAPAQWFEPRRSTSFSETTHEQAEISSHLQLM
jgi:hypothetical protein